MKLRALALATSVLVCTFAGPSYALKQGGIFEQRNGAWYQKKSSRRSNLGTGRYTAQAYKKKPSKKRYASTGGSYSGYSGGVGPRPRKWCGWWMRTQLGGGPEFNIARNWRNYGRPTSPQVGAVVVWSHHVGIITGRAADGRWIVKSGNDSGRVQERARSVKGAIFRI